MSNFKKTFFKYFDLRLRMYIIFGAVMLFIQYAELHESGASNAEADYLAKIHAQVEREHKEGK